MFPIYFNYYHYVNYYWRHYNRCSCRCCGAAIFEPKCNIVNIHLNVTRCDFPLFVWFTSYPVWTASTENSGEISHISPFL